MSVPELTKVSLFLDGQIIPELFVPVFERGAQAQVPFIVGSTSFEGVPLRRELEVPTADVLAAAGDDLAKLASLYPKGYTRTDKLLADAIWGDAFFVEPARKIAREASRGRQPVYHYLFDYRPPIIQRFLDGTPHGVDVLYVFGSFDSLLPPALLRLMKPENYAVSRTMRSYWTAFAKTGNPNGAKKLGWPAFDTTTNKTLVFGLDGVDVEGDCLKERLDLIGRLVQ
jgi:para-nitrobenzyl esterase